MGSLNSPRRTFYWSSIETIALDCFVFVKIAYFVCILATDKRTNGQTDGHTLLLLLLFFFLTLGRYIPEGFKKLKKVK